MFSRACLAVLTVVAAQHTLQPDVDILVDRPWFCHDLDCPKYELINRTDAYEVRKYQAGKWISTHSEGYAYKASVEAGFERLFKYISGSNKEQQKVDMTSPVTVLTNPGQGPACKSDFLVSFFLPHKNQEKPPEPTDGQVLITDVPEAVLYVAQHSGFLADDKIIAARTTNLLEHLQDAEVSIDGSKIFTADYDPPYRLQNRHNEIWVAAAKETQALEAS